MKKITYLNGVLTIIAFCLVIITLNILGLFPKAYAGGSLTNYSLVPLNQDGSITVKLKDVVDVDITDISTSDELGVNIEEIGGFSIYDDKLPVKVK